MCRNAYRDKAASVVEADDSDWTVLCCCLIGRRDEVIDLVLLHPRRGVALIQIAPSPEFNAVAPMRRYLGQAAFSTQFPGYLPVVQRVIHARQIAQLSEVLDEAFAGASPLSVADAAWVPFVQRILAAHTVLPVQVKPLTNVLLLRVPSLRRARRWQFYALTAGVAAAVALLVLAGILWRQQKVAEAASQSVRAMPASLPVPWPDERLRLD